MALVALTDARVYALAATFKSAAGPSAMPSATGTARPAVQTTPGRLATKVVIDVVSTGEHYELEATTVADNVGFTDAFLQALTGSPDLGVHPLTETVHDTMRARSFVA